MAKTGEIHHPKSGKQTYSAYFAAFGLAESGVTGVSGKVSSEEGDTKSDSVSGILRNSNLDEGQFWIVRFQVPVAKEKEKFTLRIYDQNGNEIAFPSKHIVIPKMVTAHQGHQGHQDMIRGLLISYPQPNDDIPEEFVAYGTAPGTGGPVSGQMDNCDPPPDTDIEQQDPAPDWTLYCYISNPNPPCTLTVNQGTAHPTVGGLQF